MTGPITDEKAVVAVADTDLRTAAAPYYFDEDPDLALLTRHLDCAAGKQPGKPVVQASRRPDGTLEILAVDDDAPLLLEGVLRAAEDAGLITTTIGHPIVPVRRDHSGQLTGFGDGDGMRPEAWICVQAIAPDTGRDDDLVTAVRDTMGRAHAVKRDGEAIRARLSALAEQVAPVSPEYGALLRWFGTGHNSQLLGYTCVGGDEPSLGVLADGAAADLPPLPADHREPVVERTWNPTGLVRNDYPLCIRVADGDREHRILCIITSAGLYQSVHDVPVVRDHVAQVLRELDVEETSFAAFAATELLQTYPLDELLAAGAHETAREVADLLDAQSSRSTRLFLRVGVDNRTVSALTFIPRDQYSSDTRLTVVDLLSRELDASDPDFAVRVSHSPLAQLRVMLRLRNAQPAGMLDVDSDENVSLRRAIAAAVRSWDDRVRDVAVDAALPILPGLSDDYRDHREPAAAAQDLRIAARLQPGGCEVDFAAPADPTTADPAADSTLTLYLRDATAALTQLLPMLQSLGLTVHDERPFSLAMPDGGTVNVFEFSVTPAPGMRVSTAPDLAERIAGALTEMWFGRADVDALGRLVLSCGLTYRQVAGLRCYVKYLRQCGAGFSTTHAAAVLADYPRVTSGLVRLFDVSLNPLRADEDRREAAAGELRDALAEVLSLDADRVLSGLASAVLATLRTNFYVPGAQTIAIKLDTRPIPQAPLPRPAFEIFVHSPRVEGVHLRFGSVARGGLRMSDRPEDFRTEVLGLVKAQAVKNAVIVPVGAKGGFVVRRPAPPTGDRAADLAAARAENIACYRLFIGSLLDVTDNLNLETGAVVPPAQVVRRDGDDPYLVVAADKGTASFSDQANAVAAEHGFWLGDAFASGGSVGYDHKVMGITARGAWEAVKRHFWEMGVDTQRDEFTAVGVGDMSGDVFGNGMLCSPHTRLIAAFDHRHIFVDPDPDAARSYVERQRMFDLPSSSWDDYDRALISPGGGVFPRSVKSIDVTAEMRAALGIDDGVTSLSPPELMRAILKAPVDLLFNGGIGTYIKAASESDAQVGDKANDAVRVNGGELRVKVVGEGGNLGATSLGRIEADLAGVRINTDAMDNSAGVDCSDHEVNIKILLDAQVSGGALPAGERTGLLESMTDEVSVLVLGDNVEQNAELGCARRGAMYDVGLYSRILARLADRGVDLALEALPTPEQLLARRAGELQRGLTSPELATVMAHVKLEAKRDLLESSLPANDLFTGKLTGYFPEPLRERFADGIAAHRLRPEIVATVIVNDLVSDGGTAFLYMLSERLGAETSDVVRAYVVADAVFGIGDLIDAIRGSGASAQTIDVMTLQVRQLLARACTWLLSHRPQPLAMAAEITRYRRVDALAAGLEDRLGASVARMVAAVREQYVARGVDPELAGLVALSQQRLYLLDAVDISDITERDIHEVAAVIPAVVEYFQIDELLGAVDQLPHADRWHLLARVALRDDLYSTVRALSTVVAGHGEPGESAAEKIADWAPTRAGALSRARSTLAELHAAGQWDVATLSVATRALRNVVS